MLRSFKPTSIFQLATLCALTATIFVTAAAVRAAESDNAQKAQEAAAAAAPASEDAAAVNAQSLADAAAEKAAAAKNEAADAADSAAKGTEANRANAVQSDTATTKAMPKRGYVNVRIDAIKAQVARQVNRKETDLPEMIEAPMAVASRACEISMGELIRREREGNMTCEAKRTTIGLNDAVRQHISQMGGKAAPGTHR